MLLLVISTIGQWLCCFLFALGIGIEIYYRADLGFLSITIAAVFFAGFTKMKELYYSKEEKFWRKKFREICDDDSA